MNPPGRWTIVEYGAASPVLREMADASGLSVTQIRELIQTTSERIAKNLKLNTLPLSIEREGLRAVEIAGLVRVAPTIELEIAPKFLGDDASDLRWREDFFFLATLSKHGKVLPSEKLRSGRSASRELPSLVARTMLEMQRSNSRRPLRTYRQSRETSFDLDGDVDAESLVLPTPDGFNQEFVRYDRQNVYNATIKAALQTLQREVGDPALRSELGRILADLGPQSAVRDARYRTLPSRSRRWQEMYDLAVDVQKGIGLSFRPDSSPRSPGFILSTWQMWEHLMTLACRLGFAKSELHAQKKIEWGKRARIEGGELIGTRALNVEPDIRLETVIELDMKTLVLDAKYGTRASMDQQRINEADVYEAIAFARATKTNTVVLLYPAVPTSGETVLGSVANFERIDVEDITIHGVQVEVRGISSSNGLRRFSDELREGLKHLVKPENPIVEA